MAAGWHVPLVIAAGLLAVAPAWFAQAGELKAGASFVAAGAARPAAPQAGTGAPAPASLPRSVAEAEAQHAETVRKCAELPVAAVRGECLREAKRTLERETARLRTAGPPGAAGR